MGKEEMDLQVADFERELSQKGQRRDRRRGPASMKWNKRPLAVWQRSQGRFG